MFAQSGLRPNNAATNLANLMGEPLAPVPHIAPAPMPAPVPVEPARQAYTNPELEMIAKEIEELAKERRQLESELVQKEADIRIKNGEVRNLQSELDTLVATLKQLENQKGEAQKRLNDLKAQVCIYHTPVNSNRVANLFFSRNRNCSKKKNFE